MSLKEKLTLWGLVIFIVSLIPIELHFEEAPKDCGESRNKPPISGTSTTKTRN